MISVRILLANYFPPVHYLRSRRNRRLRDEFGKVSDDLVTRIIVKNEPALIGRLGGTEARVISCYLDIFRLQSILDPISTFYSIITMKKRLKQLKGGAGVYPTNRKTIEYFFKKQFEALTEIDLLGCWGFAFTWVEKFALSKGLQDICISHHSVAPWVEVFPENSICEIPWSKYLEGKKVLIVSSFTQSFKFQFERIHQVFPGKDMHNFVPVYLDAPNSMGGLNDDMDWAYHLKKMEKRIALLDFDVALISAGAYALPLAHFVKKMGKIGISCGGDLQLFFGVIGARWEKENKYLKFKNQYWIRPSESERPANWREIEDGCYW